MAYKKLVLEEGTTLPHNRAAQVGARSTTKGNPNPREMGCPTVVRLHGPNSPNHLRK